MQKIDLKSGDIVKTREGNTYIVLLNAEKYGQNTNLLINLKTGNNLEIGDYNENLTYCGDDCFDIVAVCAKGYVGENIRNHIINSKDEWTWQREENKKEMTISEIEKELGYSIKVVKESEDK